MLRRVLALVLSLALVALPARATWSIVCVDTATGEVCVASATCLPDFDLKQALPVVMVGVGGGAAQAAVDLNGKNRQTIWDELMAGTPPAEIVEILKANDQNFKTRQYGIVDMLHDPAKFSGIQVQIGKKALVGEIGTIRYAMQGNLLTGAQVIDDAEITFRETEGDLSQRVMAAMETARDLGGDGRCSCSSFAPTSCGVPPPHFDKSAHVGFFVLARHGDADGTCDAAAGCASGDYFLDLNVVGIAPPDPVDELRVLYDQWRAGLAGHPDGILSHHGKSAQSLPADGATALEVVVHLRDIEETPLGVGGATLAVTPVDGGAPLVTVGEARDHGDGSYSFEVVAGTTPGTQELAIAVDDGSVQATLYPWLEVRVDPQAVLHSGHDTVLAAQGASVPLTVNAGPELAGARYLLLGSTSGTSPGLALPPDLLPLNPDAFLAWTAQGPEGGPLQAGSGTLDGTGRAQATFHAAPGALLPIAGGRIDWSVALFGPSLEFSAPAGFDVAG